MIRRFDSLIARTILVSLIGITLMHVLSLWSYELALRQEIISAQDTRLAERLVSIRQSLASVPDERRDEVAHQFSSGPLEIHWSRDRSTIGSRMVGGEDTERLADVPQRLRALIPGLAPDDLIVAAPDVRGDPHLAFLSLRLPDRSWMNVSLFAYRQPHTAAHGTLLSTTLMALGVIVISVVIAGWLTRPIRLVANAARALRPGNENTRISEDGPREVRELAMAFNDMQDRITRLIEERTRALAAVSHDLRTPLTRLKLRIEDIAQSKAPDAAMAEAMTADISELEQMIDATLSYLRGEGQNETPRALDLTALLETLVDEAGDLGQPVDIAIPRKLVVFGRHLGLKRAFSNLIQNGVKYGGRVRVSSDTGPDVVHVHVDDEGPGIPADKLEAVMEPFVRLETSRSRVTGGVGLGLTIAKSSIEADGGRLTLENRPTGGLRVTVSLPRTRPSR